MRISITIWIIVALNLAVLTEALVLGWVAQDAAGQVVEDRLAKDMVASVSRFLGSRTIPVNNAMLDYLRQMLHSDWVAVSKGGAGIVGTSLSEPLAAEFARKLSGVDRSPVMELAGERFHVDSHELSSEDWRATAASSAAQPSRLYVLIPAAQLRAARDDASRRVVRVMLPAAVVATGLAGLLAFWTSRPIRRLTSEMHRLSERQAADGATDGEAIDAGRRRELLHTGPRETRQLASAFFELFDRLAAARDRVAQSERLATLGKICLSVAHELRNPLSGIKMNMRVLQDRIGHADEPGFQAIVHEIDRMGLYLDELMTLSPATASAAGRLSETRLSSLADSVLTILSGRCRHSRIEIVRDYPTGEPLVRVDPNPIRQAMMNFIVNAIEAMPNGGTLSIAIRAADGAVRFVVGDTGGGVRADGRDIFAAFTSGKPDGVGLGLYLSKQMVTRHYGRIGYDNGTCGAQFWFEIPIASVASRDDHAGVGHD